MSDTPKDQRPEIKTPIPGPKSRAIRAREEAYLAPGAQAYALMAGVVIDRAEGSAITDVDGNTLLDFVGGIGVNALGHAHPRVVTAIRDQAAKVSVGSFTTEKRAELLERVAKHAPAPGLVRTQLYTSGAEAVESALRLAKNKTGKHEVVSFWGGFHGKTTGAMALMGSPAKRGFGPLAVGTHQVPYADCYRCPLKMQHPSCGVACVDFAKKQLAAASTGSVAAIIVEPMQGTAGNVIPPDDFLPAVRELANDLGALLIADEMITGFGRTGKWWGVDHSGVRPDIVTIGKAFGGGFPLSGVITNEDIASTRPWGDPSGSSSSYGGNPLGAASGAAALQAIEEDGLVENAQRVGGALLAMLQPFVDEFPFVGEVRGRGLFLGVELVADKKTKEPLSKNVTRRIFDECVKRGLLSMAYAPRFRIQPPLTLDEATAKNGVGVLREVFELVKREKLWEKG